MEIGGHASTTPASARTQTASEKIAAAEKAARSTAVEGAAEAKTPAQTVMAAEEAAKTAPLPTDEVVLPIVLPGPTSEVATAKPDFFEAIVTANTAPEPPAGGDVAEGDGGDDSDDGGGDGGGATTA